MGFVEEAISLESGQVQLGRSDLFTGLRRVAPDIGRLSGRAACSSNGAFSRAWATASCTARRVVHRSAGMRWTMLNVQTFSDGDCSKDRR
jgi:hypothetical protein